jgi:hypothetical protein
MLHSEIHIQILNPRLMSHEMRISGELMLVRMFHIFPQSGNQIFHMLNLKILCNNLCINLRL